MAGGLTTSHIVEASAAYEDWLRTQTSVVEADLEAKHVALASDPFVFLRGTAYRWAERFPKVCAEVNLAPTVAAVGDLHIENFGTWRDVEGRLVWGMNDIDEAADIPYTNDLVRLVTSTVVARLAIRVGEAADAVLAGYGEGGGRPFVLAEEQHFVRDLALRSLKDPDRFWDKLAAGLDGTAATDHAAAALPPGTNDVVTGHRVAGVGSLGRPRTVAVGRLAGARVAREAKAVVPSAWASGHTGADHASFMAMRLGHAVRAQDPTWATTEGWVIRRLAPDCSRIELADLPTERDERKLLHAMGMETANLHAATNQAAVRADLAGRRKGWLAGAADAMAADVVADHEAWAKHRMAAPGRSGR